MGKKKGSSNLSAEDFKKDNPSDKRIANFQCPFTWTPVYKLPVHSRPTEKLSPNHRDFKWEEFGETLFLSYKTKNAKEALIYANKCTELLEDIAKSHDHYLVKYITGLKHVSLASEAHLNAKLDIHESVSSISNNVVITTKLTDSQQAAIWGARADFYMRFQTLPAVETALESCDRAIAVDPMQGLWHLIRSRCLNVKSKMQKEMISLEEEESLESGIKLTSDPFYMTQAASVFILGAKKMRYAVSGNNDDGERIEKLILRSSELYRQALDVAGEDIYVNIECLLGFTQVLLLKRDWSVPVKSCIDKVTREGNQIPIANFALGKYYEKFQRNHALAREFYSKAELEGCYDAACTLIKLNYRLDPDTYNPKRALRNLLQSQSDIMHRVEILVQLGSYHYYVKGTLAKACECWMEASSIYYSCYLIKGHYSWFRSENKRENLYIVMKKQAMKKLNKSRNLLESERRIFRRAIRTCEMEYKRPRKPDVKVELVQKQAIRKKKFAKRTALLNEQFENLAEDMELEYLIDFGQRM